MDRFYCLLKSQLTSEEQIIAEINKKGEKEHFSIYAAHFNLGRTRGASGNTGRLVLVLCEGRVERELGRRFSFVTPNRLVVSRLVSTVEFRR